MIATGNLTSVREFVRLAFIEVGIELKFIGQGLEEKRYVGKCSNPDFQLEAGKEVINIDPGYFRPTEVDLLIGGFELSSFKAGLVP